MSIIIQFSSLCLLDILIVSNGSTDSLNIGQLLNLIFSNLFQKCSLMFIFVQLIKVILKSSYHYIIHSKSVLPVSFTHNMVYVANLYKMIIFIFAINYRLLQDDPCAQDPYDYWVEFLLLVVIQKRITNYKNKNQEKSPQRSRLLAKVRAIITLLSFCFAGFM